MALHVNNGELPGRLPVAVPLTFLIVGLLDSPTGLYTVLFFNYFKINFRFLVVCKIIN